MYANESKQFLPRVTKVIDRTKANICCIRKFKWESGVTGYHPPAKSSGSQTMYFSVVPWQKGQLKT